jgi:hypothetical protein
LATMKPSRPGPSAWPTRLVDLGVAAGVASLGDQRAPRSEARSVNLSSRGWPRLNWKAKPPKSFPFWSRKIFQVTKRGC